MASMQCYREETCQTKCYDNSFGQEVSEVTVLHGNNRTSNHGGCYYGQRNGGHQHRPDHQALSETQTCYSQTQTYYPDQYGLGKTQSAHCMSQSGYGGSGHHGMVSGGCHEKKMMNSCELKKKKKKKSHLGRKHRAGNRSCSESESDSDCD